uniref:Uncharacterized protein n=1 Tax=Anguilla anguilla TaxID=7936 RepID=A0A0E9Q5L3_ANGAN
MVACPSCGSLSAKNTCSHVHLLQVWGCLTEAPDPNHSWISWTGPALLCDWVSFARHFVVAA